MPNFMLVSLNARFLLKIDLICLAIVHVYNTLWLQIRGMLTLLWRECMVNKSKDNQICVTDGN